APGGGPPNNWLSCFGGSAWQYDERTGQDYYHAFLPEQPDLNWRNPRVVEAMLGVLRFWLERGVDGFRVDVLWHLMKHADFPDNPVNPAWRAGMDPYQALVPLYTTDLPEVHGIVARMRRLLDEYRERALIGEIYLPVERLVKYYGAGLQGAHLPFNFQLVQAPCDAAHLARLVEEYERALPECAWPNWVLGNHDKHRFAGGPGAGARRGDASAHAARDADALLRRRDRDARRCDPAASRTRSVRAQRAGPRTGTRSRAHADAVEFRHAGRLHGCRAVASARCGLSRRQRGEAARRSPLDACALPKPHRAATIRAGARDRHFRPRRRAARGPRLRATLAERRKRLSDRAESRCAASARVVAQ